MKSCDRIFLSYTLSSLWRALWWALSRPSITCSMPRSFFLAIWSVVSPYLVHLWRILSQSKEGHGGIFWLYIPKCHNRSLHASSNLVIKVCGYLNVGHFGLLNEVYGYTVKLFIGHVCDLEYVILMAWYSYM